MNIDEEKKDIEFNYNLFQQKLIAPIKFNSKHLLSNKNQVAGHAGFYSISGDKNICLKPFNVNCVRGRREHLFYQLLEFFKRTKLEFCENNLDCASNSNASITDEKSILSTTAVTISSSSSSPSENVVCNKKDRTRLYYKNFQLLLNPSSATKCNCLLDESLFQSLSPFVANFYRVGHSTEFDQDVYNYNNLVGDDQSLILERNEFLNSVYSQSLQCPCYGRNPQEKTLCARDYEKINFLCLEDLTAHCREPCIIDIKIGQITYDPMAIKEKVLEQSTKYRQLREFGFRILGVKLGDEMKGKTFGMKLETADQVSNALNSFFNPLENHDFKSCVIQQTINRLESLLKWFEQININQLRFYSSSLLIVYDSGLVKDKKSDDIIIKNNLKNSVRVSMIDFAHVFHVHEDINNSLVGVEEQKEIEKKNSQQRDDNYIFGLRKLVKFLINLNQHHQSQNFHHDHDHH